MKAVGGTLAWLGGMAMMLGGLLFLMSLKNSADLFIWSLLGMLIGGAGLVFAVIGWVIYRSDRNREMS